MKQPSACSIRFGTFGVPLTNGDVFDLGHELSMPSPGATWIFGRSSGSVDDQADDLFLENQNLRMENVYLTLDNDDLHRENADLRREIHDLRVQTENLSCRINEPVLLPAPSAPPPPPDLLPAPWAPSSVNVRASGYPKQNSSQRVFLGTKGGEDKFEGEIDGFVYKQSNRKTEMCQAHMTGECLYGDQCHFAHKTAELRLVLRHPQYKTKVCLMDLDGGGCSYGHRCHFRHSEDP